MMKIEIHEAQVNVSERSGVSQRTGKPYVIREQSGYIHMGGVYPALFKFNLEDGQLPYPAGSYTLHPGSFKINNFEQISIGRVILQSISK